MKTIARFDNENKAQFPCYSVTWQFDGDDHQIIYGSHTRVYTNDIKAAHEFGECVRHSLECAGVLDRRAA